MKSGGHAAQKLSEAQAMMAAMEGYCVPEEEKAEDAEIYDDVALFGDDAKLTPNQRRSMLMLRETTIYPRIKVKQISLSFSGAAVFFFSPIRKDGTPMPSSVLKFDTEDNVRDEIQKTLKYGGLFGLTTPKVKASCFLTDVDSNDTSALMQIDLCGGMFGLPEFASAPPVQTFASVIQGELVATKSQIDVVPIINEALERRMHAFTMSSRSVKKVDLTAMYKIVRFVGHGILNRASEGAKRAIKSPALAAGFMNPADINELDPEGCFVEGVCGKRQKVTDFFADFITHERKFQEKFQREVVIGLCHNDLHGGNLLLDSQGLVWLIDFATVKDNIHVLMDLAKFMASCLFLYLDDNATESNIRTFAKLLATTPDATTALPMVGGDVLKGDKTAAFVMDLLTRIRHCMCIYEVGDDCPSNDGVPFSVALFSWSSRMLSYSEPSLAQKSRALYYALVCAQRLLWEAGSEIGPVAAEWIDEFRQIWEGQKGRRLSTSATQVQNLQFEFDVEFPRYLAQVGTAEAWSTDFLTREKVHATDHCLAMALSTAGRLFPRHVQMSPVTKAMLETMRPIHDRYMSAVAADKFYCGRVVIIGNSGTGKSMLTRQLFSEASQQQLMTMYGSSDAFDHQPKKQDLKTKVVPLRVPIVDLSRMLEADPDTSLEADPVGDLLTQWVQRKYGQDSVPHKLILDVRSANVSIEERRSSLVSRISESDPCTAQGEAARGLRVSSQEGSDDNMGLLLLLDGYDEASMHKGDVLEYVIAFLSSEPGHLVLLSSRPGSIDEEEVACLSKLGFVSFGMQELGTEEVQSIVRMTLGRMQDPPGLVAAVIDDIGQPQYAALRQVPLILTLLLHVVRKAIMSMDKGKGGTTAASRANDIMKKTEVYQRAIRLMLHQSDASKFALRDGASDQAMVRRLHMLKSTNARKLFQTLSWHSHCKTERSFSWEDCYGIYKDKDLVSAVHDAFREGRMPIFEKVDTNDGKQMAQFSHLSFQELMAGEYAAAIVHHSSANSTADAYVSFFLSSCSKSLERDRLSVAWWLQVWMHVCEMLSPSALQDWCRVLCQDEQSKLKVGRTIRTASLGLRDRKVVSIDWDEGLVQFKVQRPTSCKARCFGLELPLSPADEWYVDRLTDIGYVQWIQNGVGSLARACARSPAMGHIMRTLVDMKVHWGCGERSGWTIWLSAIASPDWCNLPTLIEAKADLIMDWIVCGNFAMEEMNTLAAQRKMNIFAASCIDPSQMALKKMPHCWIFEQARSGTLEIDENMDPNMADPTTKLTPLMVAAAFGQAKLVKKLLEHRADVNAMNVTRCIALTFAAESSEIGTTDCLKLLVEARSDIHHKAGTQFLHGREVHSFWSWVGRPFNAGVSCVRHGKHEEFNILLQAGLDINSHRKGLTSFLAESLMLGGFAGQLVTQILDMKADPSNPDKDFLHVAEEEGELRAGNWDAVAILGLMGVTIEEGFENQYYEVLDRLIPFMWGRIVDMPQIIWHEADSGCRLLLRTNVCVPTTTRRLLDTLQDSCGLILDEFSPCGFPVHFYWALNVKDTAIWFMLFDRKFDPFKSATRGVPSLDVTMKGFGFDIGELAPIRNWTDWLALQDSLADK